MNDVKCSALQAEELSVAARWRRTGFAYGIPFDHKGCIHSPSAVSHMSVPTWTFTLVFSCPR